MTAFVFPRSERYLFEAWCNAPGLVAIPLLPGTATYASRSLQRSWSAWQARAALSASADAHESGNAIDAHQWVSVEDRLPEFPLPVLAVIAGTRKQPLRVGMATHWQLGKGFSGTDPEWMEGSNAFISARVTHWMPLTLPPVNAMEVAHV